MIPEYLNQEALLSAYYKHCLLLTHEIMKKQEKYKNMEDLIFILEKFTTQFLIKKNAVHSSIKNSYKANLESSVIVVD